ncbi:hypothetical protein LOAG_15913, partial [Loa loa]
MNVWNNCKFGLNITHQNEKEQRIKQNLVIQNYQQGEDILGLTVQFYPLKAFSLRQENARGKEFLVYFTKKKK